MISQKKTFNVISECICRGAVLICLSGLSGPLFPPCPLSGLADPLFLYPLISAFLHFGVSLCHPSMVTSPLSLLLGLEIVSLALGLITVLSRSVSLSFRGVESLIRFLKDLMHTCLHDLCGYMSPKPWRCALSMVIKCRILPLESMT